MGEREICPRRGLSEGWLAATLAAGAGMCHSQLAQEPCRRRRRQIKISQAALASFLSPSPPIAHEICSALQRPTQIAHPTATCPPRPLAKPASGFRPPAGCWLSVCPAGPPASWPAHGLSSLSSLAGRNGRNNGSRGPFAGTNKKTIKQVVVVAVVVYLAGGPYLANFRIGMANSCPMSLSSRFVRPI